MFVVAEGVFNILDDVLGLGSTDGERPHQAGKIVYCDLIRKLDAGESGGGQELGKAAFRLPGFHGDAIEQQAMFGNAEQKSSVSAFRQPGLQLAPRSLELAFGTLMVKAIKADVLDQDIEAMDKGACGRDPVVSACVCREDTRLLKFSSVTESG